MMCFVVVVCSALVSLPCRLVLHSCVHVCFGALFRFVAVACCAVVCRLALCVALCCWLGTWESTWLHFGRCVEMTRVQDFTAI